MEYSFKKSLDEPGPNKWKKKRAQQQFIVFFLFSLG